MLDYRVNMAPDLGIEPRLYPKPMDMSTEAQEAFDSIMEFTPKNYVAANRYPPEDFVRIGFVPIAVTQIDPYWNPKGRQTVFDDMYRDGLLERTEHIYFLDGEKEGTSRTYALNGTIFDKLRQYDSYPLHELITYLRKFSGILNKRTYKALSDALREEKVIISASHLSRFGSPQYRPRKTGKTMKGQAGHGKHLLEPPGLKKALARMIDDAGLMLAFEEWRRQQTH